MELEKVRAPNIRDVARLAGVSYQTVSRVLNDSPSIRPATKQRVLDVISELGFRPNQAARTLVTSRSRTIGVLTSQTAFYGPTTSLHAIEQAAREAGYRVSDDEPGIQRPCGHPGRPATSDEPGHRGARRHRPAGDGARRRQGARNQRAPGDPRFDGPGCRAQPCGGPGRRRSHGHSPPDRSWARRDCAHRRPPGLDRGRGTDARLPRRDRGRRTAHAPADPRGLDCRLRLPRRAGNSPGSATSPRCSPPTTRWRSGCCTRSARPDWMSPATSASSDSTTSRRPRTSGRR